MSENLGRLSVDQIENLVNHTEEGEIELQPNGDVIRLTPEELVKKEHRQAKEAVAILRSEAKKLRAGLKRIVAELDELLP